MTRDLAVIDAVAARLPADRVAALECDPNVTGVWQDAAVGSTDSADPGDLYAPVAGGAAERAGFDLSKLVACDGSRVALEEIPLGTTSPFVFQGLTFKPARRALLVPNAKRARALGDLVEIVGGLREGQTIRSSSALRRI